MSYKGILRKAGINVDNNTITFDRSKDLVMRLRSSLTVGTIRGINNTVTMTGRSSANIVEGLRSAITANVKTGAWCNAIVGSINYSTSGAAHGMAASICAEMIPPNSSLERGGLYSLDCCFGCGASSSWGSAGPVAFMRFENWGTKAHFSANAFLFHLVGETGALGALLSANERTLKVRIGSTTKYLHLSDTEDALGGTGAITIEGTITNDAILVGSAGTPLVYPLSDTQNTCVSIYADLTDPGDDKFFRGLYVRTRYMPSDLTGEASVYGIRGHVQTVATYNNNGDVEYVCGVHGMVQGVAEADIIGTDFMVSGIRGELIGAADDWNVKSVCAVEAKLGLTVVPTATYYSAFHAYSPGAAATYPDILSADGYFTTGFNFGSHVVSLVNLFSIDITGGPAVATTDATADKEGSIAILIDGVQKWLQYWPNAAA